MKSRLIVMAGCLILGLIVFCNMANASVPQATVYISGSNVIAVDSQSNVIKQGTLGTDDATVILAAINALDKSNSVLTISPGTYVIDRTIVISGFTGLTINGKGARIKLKDHYSYTGAPSHYDCDAILQEVRRIRAPARNAQVRPCDLNRFLSSRTGRTCGWPTQRLSSHP